MEHRFGRTGGRTIGGTRLHPSILDYEVQTARSMLKRYAQGMGSIWSRVRVWATSGVRQQITRAGLLFSLALLIIGLAAFASANNLLFLILAAMLATFLVSGFISRLSLAGLELELLHPEHLCARRRISGRVIVHNEKSFMPSFSIQLTGTPESGFENVLYFPSIPGGARLEESVDLLFPERGAYRENTFTFSTRFPFGFTERRAPVRVTQDVLVYPSVDPQPALEALLAGITGEIQAHLRGRSGDFYRIRPYEQLESARHVDWKATAHTGDLQVREFAREEQQSIAIFLDLELPGGDIFENAVECCAYLAWQITRAPVARLTFTTQSFSVRVPEEGEVYTILKYLALVQPSRGKVPPPPDDLDSIHIMFTAQPERLSASGWRSETQNGSFVVGPDRLSVERPNPDGSPHSGSADGSHSVPGPGGSAG